jgi:aryl-alcohol dehydrogenase-like predicted oxidoreductase
MNQIVIGGAGFNHLSQKKLNNLLDYAFERGVDQIDTAPLYGKSEVMIGEYSKTNPNFKISTKIGLPRFDTLTSLDIKKQFQESLEKMQTNKINLLFFHSLPISMMTIENIETVKNFKLNGLINEIGYSGNGHDFRYITEANNFDSYMATFNALDISDFISIVKVSDKTIYIKRPLANAIFHISKLGYLKQNLKAFLNLPNTTDFNGYLNRYEIMFGKRKIFNNYLQFFIDFLVYFQPKAKYVFGVSQKKHLKQVLDACTILDHEVKPQLIEYFKQFEEVAKINKWTSLI